MRSRPCNIPPVLHSDHSGGGGPKGNDRLTISYISPPELEYTKRPSPEFLALVDSIASQAAKHPYPMRAYARIADSDISELTKRG